MPDHTTPTKKCARCQETHPATTEFFSVKKGKRELRSWCNVCVSEYEEQNPNKFTDTRSEYMRAYQADPEAKQRQAVSNKKWRKANSDTIRALRNIRRARLRAASGSHDATDIARQYKAQKGKCYYCKARVGDSYHVDHVIPLSRGGSNGPENLVIACRTCNLSKKDKLPSEWVQGGRLL